MKRSNCGARLGAVREHWSAGYRGAALAKCLQREGSLGQIPRKDVSFSPRSLVKEQFTVRTVKRAPVKVRSGTPTMRNIFLYFPVAQSLPSLFERLPG